MLETLTRRGGTARTRFDNFQSAFPFDHLCLPDALSDFVLDGFGAMPMNSAAFKLLTTNNKREVTVNAEHFDRYSGNRPEVIIPLPVSTEPRSQTAMKHLQWDKPCGCAVRPMQG